MQLAPEIEKLLHEIAQTEGFSNYKFELEAGSKPGDNYQGLMVSVKVIGDRVNDGAVVPETLSLICKLVPESKERRNVFKTVLIHEREIHMYTRVLPKFVKFQQEKGLTADESFLSIPKLYAWTADKATETYALIMEDLRANDFVMWPRKVPVTLDHEELLFKQLGRFHGISFALKDQRPEVFDEFKNLNDIFIDWIETGFIGKVIDEAIELAINVLDEDEHKNVIKKLRNNYLETLKSFSRKEAIEKIGVVVHGDCWTNNFLFQYTENATELKDIRFIDFQLSRYASPVEDVLYHLYSSTTKSLRDQSYNDLLNIYYNSLSEMVSRLGSDPAKLFRFCDFQTQLKAHGKFALIMGIFLLPFALSQQREITDMEEYAELLLKGEQVNMFRADGLTRNDVYAKAVKEMLIDVINYDYDY